MKCFLILLVLLQSFALMSCDSDGEKNTETWSEVKDDWIDPHNMVDDYHAVWIKKNGDNTHSMGIDIMERFSNKYSEDVIRRAFSNIREELKNCERKLEANISSSSSLNTETIVLLICVVIWLTTVIVIEMTTRLTAQQCPQAEAVEHSDWEVVEGNHLPEGQGGGRLWHPVQASELNPTKNTGPD